MVETERRLEWMLEQVRAMGHLSTPHSGIPDVPPRILDAMRAVPRHLFVSEALQDSAYDNRPLPIGHGQTISQPYIVALMTALLDPQPQQRILEIGTGSGYQAAILACLAAEIYTVEIVATLGARAAALLGRFSNIRRHIGDGSAGWPEYAPYDGVLVTAAAAAIPEALFAQLRPGGRLVAPVGAAFDGQELMVFHKREDGTLRESRVLPVRFVPLTGTG